MTERETSEGARFTHHDSPIGCAVCDILSIYGIDAEHLVGKAEKDPRPEVAQARNEVSSEDFRNGVRAMRILLKEEMDKPDHVMIHTHNPDVKAENQSDYCWRCKLERVMDAEIKNYHRHLER